MPAEPSKSPDDSPCPACGCHDAELLRAGTPGEWFGQGQARCRHCGKVYRFTAVETIASQPAYRVVRPRLRCPACRSVEVRTHTTRPERDGEGEPIPDGSVLRYHTCLVCEYNFSSLER